jgi:hypothetical protein
MKVLIISNEKEDTNILNRYFDLTYKNLGVLIASNKEEAINYTSVDGPFAFIIIDVDNKELDPDNLCRKILDFAGEKPFIFLGLEHTINQRISDEILNSTPYNDYLFKPVGRSDFQQSFEQITTKAMEFARQEEYESNLEDINPEDFIPMKLKGFYLYQTFPYDLYLKITPTRFLKAIGKNEPYTINQLSQYAKKSIRFLYIKKDDQLKYLEEESKKCLKSLEKTNAQTKDLILVCLRSFTLIHQSLIAIGITPTVNELSEKTIDVIIEMFRNHNNFVKVLKEYPNIYTGIASKSLLTAIIALLLCRKMNWESDLVKRKLVFSALLHDHTLPDEDMAKINSPNDPKLENYPENLVEDFLAHPLKSSEVAKQFSGYSDIDFIIESHHETPNRKGFPNKPSHTKVTSLSSVFNIAQFVAAEVDGFTIEKKTLSDAIRLLNRDYSQGNFKEPKKLLKDFVKAKF